MIGGASSVLAQLMGLKKPTCASSTCSIWPGAILSARPDWTIWARMNSRASTLWSQKAVNATASAIQQTRGTQKRGRARMDGNSSRGEKSRPPMRWPRPCSGAAAGTGAAPADEAVASGTLTSWIGETAYAGRAAKVKSVDRQREAGATSLVAQRFDRVETGGLGRGPQAEEEAHRERGEESN